MNNSYYVNYLKGSTCYRNLIFAKGIISELTEELNDLISAFTDSSGNIVERMNNDVSSIKNKLAEINSQVGILQDDLMANARLFDGVYNNWLSKKGTVYKSEKSDLPQTVGYNTYIDYVIKDVGVGGDGYINIICEMRSRTIDASGMVVSSESMGPWGKSIKFY